jgi:glycosyltransferase involved in cell wall biosynthesis
MNKLSAVIITKNEEKNIERCLKSLSGWTDEIILVDSGSQDKTLEIAKKYNCRIFNLEKWEGFGKTKQYAVNQANNNWIFSIDADEEVTKDLKNSILNILKGPKYNWYKIKRISFFLGRKILHGGWDKDFPKRLFNKKYGNFNDKLVHESVVCEGILGIIEEHLLHYTYDNLKSYIYKMEKYADLKANETISNINLFSSFLRALSKFIKMFFIHRGFLDGKEGFVLAALSSFGVFYKYLKVWERHR